VLALLRHARLPILLAAALVALAAGCGGGGSGSVSGGDVAVVGDVHITRAEVDALLARAERSFKAQKRAFPKAGSTEYRQLQDQAVLVLVRRAEIAQKAEALGVDVSDKQVEERLKQIKKQYFGGSEKRYRDALEDFGLTDAQYRDEMRAQLLSEAIFEKLATGVSVSEAEVKAYYDAHPQQYTTPQTREVRHILVKDKALAEKLYRQLEAGADFAALAKKYSTDRASKAVGGKYTVTRGQAVAPFDRVAFALKTGEISKPVRTIYGWHVIQALKAAKPRQSTPFKQVKEAIRQQLRNQQRSERVRKWLDDLTKEYCGGKLKFKEGFQPTPDPCAPPSATPGAPTPTQAR